MIFKRMKRIIIICGIVLLSVSPVLSQSGRKDVAEGNKLYKSEQYLDALNRYQIAAADNPNTPEINYNLGTALYKLGKYEEAFAEFDKALKSDDALLHSQSYYNMGNAFYRMGKLPEAILAYTKALQINPDDYDAKYNLEFVRNKLKQQQQNQPGQEKEQKEQQAQQQQGKEQTKEQEQQAQPQKEQQKQKQGEQQKKNEQNMTKEEAERILNALEADEKNILQKQRPMPPEQPIRVKKDW